MKIVAISGGEKTAADTHALEFTGDSRPSVLLNPSAASTERSYERNVAALSAYFGELGVKAAVLHEFGEQPSATRIQHDPTPYGQRPDTRLEALIATFPDVSAGYAIDNHAAAVFDGPPVRSRSDAHVRVLTRTDASIKTQILE